MKLFQDIDNRLLSAVSVCALSCSYSIGRHFSQNDVRKYDLIPYKRKHVILIFVFTFIRLSPHIPEHPSELVRRNHGFLHQVLQNGKIEESLTLEVTKVLFDSVY